MSFKEVAALVALLLNNNMQIEVNINCNTHYKYLILHTIFII